MLTKTQGEKLKIKRIRIEVGISRLKRSGL
jgi:hypothetical protein